MQQKYGYWKVIAFVSAILLIHGCAKQESKYDKLWDDLFSSCGPGCHSPNGTQSDGPDMSSKDSFYTNLVNKTPSDFSWFPRTGDCNDVKFINPGSANSSLVVSSLIEEVSDTLAAANNCTSAYSLHVAEQANIDNNSGLKSDLISWVNDGAKKED